MGSVRTPILGRPRPLPGDRPAHPDYTLNCNEPRILAAFHTCPIPEVARLGRTLRRRREAFPAHLSTDRANSGRTEAVTGIVELQRRIARGHRYRDGFRLRMLSDAGGLNPCPHRKPEEPLSRRLQKADIQHVGTPTPTRPRSRSALPGANRETPADPPRTSGADACEPGSAPTSRNTRS